MGFNEMDFSNVSPELKAKAMQCKSKEELLELAKSEGIELSDEQISSISGGREWICEKDYCLGYKKS